MSHPSVTTAKTITSARNNIKRAQEIRTLQWPEPQKNKHQQQTPNFM